MVIIPLLAALATASGADLVAPQSAPQGRAVRLWCELDRPGRYSVRYANLTFLPGFDGEVAITAGHGLSENQQCELRSGGEGVAAQIHRLEPAGTPGEDWAVIRADHRFRGEVERFPIAMTADTRFTAMLKINSTSSSVCRAFPPPEYFWWPDTVLLHDCVSLPGRSGAPLRAAAQDETFLVGINLGSVFDPEKRLGRVSYWRRIDPEIADALVAAGHATTGPP